MKINKHVILILLYLILTIIPFTVSQSNVTNNDPNNAPITKEPIAVNDTNRPRPAKINRLDYLVDPNDLVVIEALISPPINKTMSWLPPIKYWQPNYHYQVTGTTFSRLHYQYQIAASPYPVEKLNVLKQNLSTAHTAQANDQLQAKVDEIRFAIEQVYTIIHQWQSINEDEDTAKEIVRTIELTKRHTEIYKNNHELAINAKRTLGIIAVVNKKFDITSRIAIEKIIRGDTDIIIENKVKKLLADLKILLDHLALDNDALSESLGMGKIVRTSMPLKKIDYHHQILPITPKE
jgi:hypothetical protein